jgi:acylphosphatase
MSAAAERVRVLYSGTVQGVGFRARAVDAARGIAVTGYVRNLPDGRVELVAEGSRGDVERLLDAVRGRLGYLIVRADASWSAASGEFPRFGVLR